MTSDGPEVQLFFRVGHTTIVGASHRRAAFHQSMECHASFFTMFFQCCSSRFVNLDETPVCRMWFDM